MQNAGLNEDDFIFLDPPYDSEFSTYAKMNLREKIKTIGYVFITSLPGKVDDDNQKYRFHLSTI